MSQRRSGGVSWGSNSGQAESEILHKSLDSSAKSDESHLAVRSSQNLGDIVTYRVS